MTREQAIEGMAKVRAGYIRLYTAAEGEDDCWWCCGGGDQWKEEIEREEAEIWEAFPEMKVSLCPIWDEETGGWK